MLQLLYHSSYPIIYISFELMHNKKKTPIHIYLSLLLSKILRELSKFPVLKKNTPYHRLNSIINPFDPRRRIPFHVHFENPKIEIQRKEKKKKKQLCLLSKISSFPRVESRVVHSTLRINLIKLHRIATRSKDPRLLLFLLSAENRCAPLNDARRHLCDGKLTPRWKRWKAGKSYLFRRVAKKESWPGHKNFET